MAKFILKCPACRWSRVNSGRSDELSDLTEIVRCKTCGRTREFKCPDCGKSIKLLRVKI